MKSYKTAIIALVVLVVAVAGYFTANHFINNSKTPEPTQAPNAETEMLYPFDRTKAVKIVTEGKENFTLELTANGTWVCQHPAHVNASSAAVSNIVTLLSSAYGEVLYGEGEFDGKLKDYGLDEPSLFTIYFNDDTKVTYKIGGLNHSGNKYYLMMEGSDKIYAINTSYGEKLCLTQASVTEGDLIVFPDVEKMAYVELRKKGETFYKFAADFEGDENGSKLWNIVKPIEISGNSPIIEEFITAVDSLLIADTVETNCQDLSQYGLDLPAFEYIFTDNKGIHTISLGNKTSDGVFYYCAVNGGTDVFRVYVSNLQFVDNPVLSYAYTYAFFENYTTLNSIDIRLNGKLNESHKLEFAFADEDEKIWFNEVPAKSEDKIKYDYLYEVKGITTYCYALQIDKIEPEMTIEKGDLLCKITYNRKDGSSCVVEAYERDNATAYLFVDGKYLGGYCETRRIFSEVDHEGLAGTIHAYQNLIKDVINQ